MNSKASRIQVENPAKARNYGQKLDVSRCFCWMMAICFCRSTVVSWCFFPKNTSIPWTSPTSSRRVLWIFEACFFWPKPQRFQENATKKTRLPSRKLTASNSPLKMDGSGHIITTSHDLTSHGRVVGDPALNGLISKKSRLVKYYNLARWLGDEFGLFPFGSLPIFRWRLLLVLGRVLPFFWFFEAAWAFTLKKCHAEKCAPNIAALGS